MNPNEPISVQDPSSATLPAYAKVRFEETAFPLNSRQPERSRLSRFVISNSGGLITSEKGVTYAALSFFIISLLCSFYLLFVFRKGDAGKTPEAFENKPFLPLEKK